MSTYGALLVFADEEASEDLAGLIGVTNIFECLSRVLSCLYLISNMSRNTQNPRESIPASARITSSPPGCCRRVDSLQTYKAELHAIPHQ